jgi:hypothetical protein
MQSDRLSLRGIGDLAQVINTRRARVGAALLAAGEPDNFGA